MENPIKMDDLGVPGTPIFGNTQFLSRLMLQIFQERFATFVGIAQT